MVANLSDIVGVNALTNPMTASGDIIYGGASGAPTRLAKGDDDEVLTLVNGVPAWAAASGGGAIDWSNPISVTGSTTLTIGRHHVCSGTSADYTVTLPAASGNAGKLISVEMSGALTKLVTLDGNASETIDGATTRVMWARETAILFCDGTQWTKVGGKSIAMSAQLSLDGTQQFNASVKTLLNYSLITHSNCPSSFVAANDKKIITCRLNPLQFSINAGYNNTGTTNGFVAVFISRSDTGATFDLYAFAPYLASNFSCVSNLGIIRPSTSGEAYYPFGLHNITSFPTVTVSRFTGPANISFMSANEIIEW